MYLVAGLGNPGNKYAFTRHNIGFRVVSRLAEKYWPGQLTLILNKREL